MGICPICQKNAELERHPEIEVTQVICECCGKFKITDEAIDAVKESKYKSECAKFSSILKEREINNKSLVTIFLSPEEAKKDSENRIAIEELLERYPKDLKTRVDKVLLNISARSRYTGDYVELKVNDAASNLCCDSYENNAAFFMLNLLYNEKLIESYRGDKPETLPIKIRLTSTGWSRVCELQGSNIEDSKDVFVAMSFDTELNETYNNGIKKAIVDTNYIPIRVDAVEFNDKICDEIIAHIRKAKFVIADVTQHKTGVYFEAGFAMGLGKPVIWTCKEEDLEKVHFDTRQYNHIFWKDENDLYERLTRRIQATII